MKHLILRAISLFSLSALLVACDDPAGPELPRAAAVDLGPGGISLAIGQTVQVPIEVRDSAGQVLSGLPVRWSTSDSTVVAISGTGAIFARGPGSASITAAVDTVRGTVTVRVFASGFQVWPDTLALLPGTTRQVQARALPHGPAFVLTSATWESSNPSVARVDSAGRVTTVANGRATITARAGDVRMTGEVYVFSHPQPVRLASISVSRGYSCGLDGNGQAYCWGSGRFGQLGTEHPTDRCEYVVRDHRGFISREAYRCTAVPVPVGTGLRFTALSSGSGHVCGVASTGSVYCWGNDSHGALGIGSSGGRIHTPTRVAGDVEFRSISAGEAFTCGVSATDAAYCWGRNSAGMLGDGTTTDSNVPSRVAGGFAFTQVEVGYGHACGVTMAGDAYCWGRNVAGELGAEQSDACGPQSESCIRPVPVSGGLKFRQISAGTFVTCGITQGDMAYCWGKGGNGLLGDGQGQNSSVPVAVSSSIPLLNVSTGTDLSCALDGSGTPYCWGRNVLHADGTRPTVTLVPTRSAPTTPVRVLDVGWPDVCGIGTDGIAMCWANTTAERVPGQ